MDFRSYLQNSIVTKGLKGNKFGTLTSSNIDTDKLKNLSLFSSASLEDIKKLDLEKLLNNPEASNVNGDQQALADIVKSFMSIEDIQSAADVDGDGTISEQEALTYLQNVMGQDGDISNLTYEDIDNLLKEMGIDLNEAADKAVSEALEEESINEIANENANKNVTPSSGPASSPSAGGIPTAGGSRAASSSPVKSSGNDKAETPEEIQAKIDEKNEEIDGIETDAEAKIAEEEQAKEEAMKRAGVSDEEYEKYQKQEEQYEKDIKSKEEAISKKDDEISDYNSTIDSNKGYIASLETQIQDNESRKSSISSDDENYSSKISEIDSKISNLENEKAQKEQENADLEAKVKQAEEEKQQLEQEKAELEAKKEELLSQTLNDSEGFAKGIASGTAVSDIKNQIAEYDNNIKEIRAEKAEKVNSVKAEIQDLQVQLKDAQALEDRAAFLKENKANQGLGLSGEELVDVAKQMLDKYGSSKGYCATGVSRTFQMAYGITMRGNGCDWTANMDSLVKQGAFEEVTGDYATSEDLAKLPAGAVVTWDSTGGTSGGAKYGHVTIADGKGGEISDHYAQNIYKSIGGRRDTYHVYIPV